MTISPYLKKFILALLLFVPCLKAYAEDASLVSPEIIQRILEQGVPELSLQRILNVMKGDWGKNQTQSIYRCDNLPEKSIKPCSKSKRYLAETQIELRSYRYGISIDYSLPSTEKRLYFIDFATGEVEKQLVAHGIGSGDGLYATDFSNIMDSRMTSIGMFLIQGAYRGAHGETLRLYGLESTNDEAYRRDIVFHGAWYADANFIKETNPKTGEAYGRLGLSYGCPAISKETFKRYLKLFMEEGGGYLDSYHPDFISSALPVSGG